jgi:uncharacterized membrane protein
MATRDRQSKDPIARLVEEQSWITPGVEVALQRGVRALLGGDGEAGARFREILHGTWLHEPLHAVMTDVPVGSWTAAVIFDSLAALTGNQGLDKAADALVILGLISAGGAAVTGMNDWSEIKSEAPRKIGLVHAALNIVATGVFAGSWWARRQRRTRSTGRALGALGFVIVAASAHLGGNLIYEHGIGVERGKAWQD